MSAETSEGVTVSQALQEAITRVGQKFCEDRGDEQHAVTQGLLLLIERAQQVPPLEASSPYASPLVTILLAPQNTETLLAILGGPGNEDLVNELVDEVEIHLMELARRLKVSPDWIAARLSDVAMRMVMRRALLRDHPPCDDQNEDGPTGPPEDET